MQAYKRRKGAKFTNAAYIRATMRHPDVWFFAWLKLATCARRRRDCIMARMDLRHARLVRLRRDAFA